jgi:hypothetical protein
VTCTPLERADGEVVGFVCTRGRKQKLRPCPFDGCDRPATLLCDGTGCDRPMCTTHSIRDGARDLCPSCVRAEAQRAIEQFVAQAERLCRIDAFLSAEGVAEPLRHRLLTQLLDAERPAETR